MKNLFDTHAKSYDAVFTHSTIGKAQRSRVYHFLNPIILTKKSLSILEINCGTGEDAAYFHKLGHQVIATDISERMIQVAKKKYPNITFKQLDATQINKNSFTHTFDLIFSNFGGLNCLSPTELQKFITNSQELLKPKGKLALVIMPKQCLWEQFYFFLKGNLKLARRRNTTNAVLVNVEGEQVPTWYYNPKFLLKMASKIFIKTDLRPVGIAVPPSYLEPFFKNKKGLFSVLTFMERIFKSGFWAKYADHFLIVLRSKE